jgi:SAM-dependent methyltransferase
MWIPLYEGCGVCSRLPSIHLATKKGLKLPVAGQTPRLPFHSGLFDGVMASLVITHFASYEEALADMVRVLRRGGKLAVTTWAAGASEFALLWRLTAESFVEAEELQRTIAAYHPWEDWFTDPKHIADGLSGAGLSEIRWSRV